MFYVRFNMPIVSKTHSTILEVYMAFIFKNVFYDVTLCSG